MFCLSSDSESRKPTQTLTTKLSGTSLCMSPFRDDILLINSTYNHVFFVFQYHDRKEKNRGLKNKKKRRSKKGKMLKSLCVIQEKGGRNASWDIACLFVCFLFVGLNVQRCEGTVSRRYPWQTPPPEKRKINLHLYFSRVGRKTFLSSSQSDQVIKKTETKGLLIRALRNKMGSTAPCWNYQKEGENSVNTGTIFTKSWMLANSFYIYIYIFVGGSGKKKIQTKQFVTNSYTAVGEGEVRRLLQISKSDCRSQRLLKGGGGAL